MTITDKMITDAIASMDTRFDSHEVIAKVAKTNQKEYIAELYQCMNHISPFNCVHSMLGTRIKKICSDLGYSSMNSRSSDIFNQNISCQLYHKEQQPQMIDPISIGL